MDAALDEVAAAAEEVAADQRMIARRARVMQRQRADGWSWSKILDGDGEPPLIELLRRSGRRLGEAAGRFAQTMASGLSAEGESRRQIARRLHVTHQRVSAMLKGHRPLRTSDPTSDG